MSQSFPQNIIAMIWDFDKTLISGYMQTPLFRHYGVDEGAFWQEVTDLRAQYGELSQHSDEIRYLNHILDYVRKGIFKDLNNAKLRELGAELEFYPGLPEFFGELRRVVEDDEKYRRCHVEVEHYVVSAGLAQMIRGSALGEYLNGVWGCEFVDEEINGVTLLSKIGYVLDDTTKTRVVFEINKGVNVFPEKISVNAYMDKSQRRVPIEQMIYTADGPSDVPVFSVVRHFGGRTCAVYDPKSNKAFKQAYALHQKERRTDMMGEADYQGDSEVGRWLLHTVKDIGDEIVQRHQKHLEESVGNEPSHRLD